MFLTCYVHPFHEIIFSFNRRMIVLLINFKLKFIWIIFLISLNIAEIQTTSNESNSNPFFEGNKQSNQSVNGRQANKFSELCLFWLVLIFQFKFVRWGTWSGDIYPIFHGGYVSNWYGDGVQEEYAYWHLEDIFLMDMDLYSNDDLLFTYQSQIQHNPLLSENLPLQNSILVKVDNKVSTTIWAKEIFDYSISVNLQINKSFLINDTAWSLFFTLLSGLNIIECKNIVKINIEAILFNYKILITEYYIYY